MAIMKKEPATKEQARVGMLAATERIQRERENLKTKVEELKEKMRVGGKSPTPASFAMEDVAPNEEILSAQQTWEKIRRIEDTLKQHNSIDAEFRKNAVVFVDAIAEEAAEMLREHDKQIELAEIEIKAQRSKIAALKTAKREKMIEYANELAGAGMGSLGHRFARYETPLTYTKEYKELCQKLDNGEEVHYKRWEEINR